MKKVYASLGMIGLVSLMSFHIWFSDSEELESKKDIAETISEASKNVPELKQVVETIDKNRLNKIMEQAKQQELPQDYQAIIDDFKVKVSKQARELESRQNEVIELVQDMRDISDKLQQLAMEENEQDYLVLDQKYKELEEQVVLYKEKMNEAYIAYMKAQDEHGSEAYEKLVELMESQ
ncbi:hypothetical protein [Pseudobacteriovorax antillogorgiicola]|uniref:Uncharacterized protein n=1 Tax=Pseudobacteriovorax antillogorgiicola TaxID=1513793 RepID=A0A1Y6CB74_9BACT|nr:hypothetical protein [Pseudobacteriovorax antillogorgiicola]TCS48652.1 hypothetical protein EDD56_11774 [Pseudobacteriovorax antillogorgiicola]SMF55166.1 hypothetical protein SAMN06296036_11785 [Pseudobacteriovorax antillogorgiicola]